VIRRKQIFLTPVFEVLQSVPHGGSTGRPHRRPPVTSFPHARFIFSLKVVILWGVAKQIFSKTLDKKGE